MDEEFDDEIEAEASFVDEEELNIYRTLRAEQDKEYRQSLEADQEKVLVCMLHCQV